MTEYSSYLFAMPSFLEGVGRIADLGGTMADYNFAPTAGHADALAFRADHSALASDAATALRQLAGELEAKADALSR